MTIRTATAFAAGAVAAVVLAGGTTYAATGGNFILGRTNTAGVYSTLSNPNGTALVVKSKAGQPSLRVSDPAMVPKLNADRLDNREGADFALKSDVGTIIAGGVVEDFGTTEEDDDLIVAEAQCPTGSQVMGGGAYDGTEDGIPYQSSPLEEEEGWVVASTATPTEDNAELVVAFARCWNPSGDVTDTAARKAPRELSPSAKRMIAGATRDK